jgi:DNA-binding NarL/FixJ family response regulator
MNKILVISGSSLLTQGLISRLRQHSDEISLRVVELSTGGCLSQVTDFSPDIIIVDESDFKATLLCTLENLLKVAPNAKTLVVGMDNTTVHMIQSAQFAASSTDDLLRHLDISSSSDTASAANN